MSVFQFKVGDLVRSTFRGRWVGVVIDRQNRKDATPLYGVRIVLEPNGRPMSKNVRARPQQMDEYWLRPYTPSTPEEAEVIQVWVNPTAKWSQLPAAARVASRWKQGGFTGPQ